MLRKWSTLAAVTAVIFSAGLSWADEDSALHRAMEKVSKNNNLITKGVRTPVAFKKLQKDVVTAAEELVKLGKESRDDTEPAKRQKKSQAEWTKLMDDYIQKSEKLQAVASKGSTQKDQADTKKAHGAVKASCTNCHNVFRVEDDK